MQPNNIKDNISYLLEITKKLLSIVASIVYIIKELN